jgi:hypothetical protein
MGGLQDPNAARRLANGNRELTRHLRDEFARAAQKVAAEAERKILAAGTHHPGMLRAEIAGTVSVRGRVTRSGFSAEIRSDGTLMPPGKQNLPAYANAGQARWRRWKHPVYARSDQARDEWTWVTQEWPSARGWLDQTVRDEAQRFSAAVQAAVDETQRYLEGR